MGSGGDPLEEAERSVRDAGRKFRNDFWGETIKTITGGHVSRDGGKGWNFESGRAIRSWNEGLREMTGANKARAEGYVTEDLRRNLEAKKEMDRKEKELADYRADVQASQGARGIYETAAARSQKKLGAGSIEDEEVLGL